MKKILALVASPRRLGNCEIMAKEIARRVPEPHVLQLLRLTAFDLRPCRACYACLFGAQRCPQDDDLNTVLEAVVGADALIVAAPTYFLGANGALKRLTDRGLAFYAHLDRLWAKPAVGVGVAGIAGKEGHTLLDIDNFLSMLLAERKMTTIIYGALPGEIFFDAANRETAARLATALFGPAVPAPGPRCPLCGGDTFRFLGNDRVRCMLCSYAGTVGFKNGVPVFDLAADAHSMFLSKAAASGHRDWLTGMKARFMAEKKRLKQVVLGYRQAGEWIEPGDRPPPEI